MKLRIKGNTIRLRLSQSEVAAFKENGLVKEHIEFGPTTLTYLLETVEGEKMTAVYDLSTIRIGVPKSVKSKWTATDQVGFEAIVNYDDQQLDILVEKDFQCLIPRKEDESDLYVNPKA